MISNRFNCIEQAITREPINVKPPSTKISDFFATNVFTKEAMREHLSEEAFLSVMTAIEAGKKIDRKVANQVASAMKAWAMNKGATHFSHWFQPLTGATAEKHDSFFEPDGTAGIENFSGNSLVQQEPDASSFPSGGLRATFEARGYTAWDPSSPAFLIEVGNSKTLCIPTIFVAYTGEALDYKAPLLKASRALEEAAIPVCQYFDRNVKKVQATLGWEQEYFLVDKALYYARPDLVLTGRTVFGHGPAKGQQLDDHYFGPIAERTYQFMVDLETESLKLGIPVRTRHNEVAPGQYECAPTFEDVNLASDHNQLLMDLMDRIARRHNLRVLFHEKPFAGVNGSGKHNNWSMATDTGKNLLSPGKTPKNNLQFLTFFINTIKAVHEHDDLLRASIASASNEHRLGANEAPPAIISIFIGDLLTKVLDEIERRASGKLDEQDSHDLKLDLHNIIPDLLLDNTDRNRTSPFAFTGNKFEIRAVGSTTNCAGPMTVMNTIVAQQLKTFYSEVEARRKAGEKKEEAILHVLRQYITDSRDILFEGDNYSEAWEKEAAKRGLNNIKETPKAIDAYITKKSIAMFEETGVYTEKELHALHEIFLENFTLKIQIEARAVGGLTNSHIIPAAVRYLNLLTNNVKSMQDIGLTKEDCEQQLVIIRTLLTNLNNAKVLVDELIATRKEVNEIENAQEKAIAYSERIIPYFERIRKHVDRLEQIVDDKEWPLPKYRELLFVR